MREASQQGAESAWARIRLGVDKPPQGADKTTVIADSAFWMEV